MRGRQLLLAVGVAVALCVSARAGPGGSAMGRGTPQGATLAATEQGGSFLTAKRWSPYAVGIGIGVLSWLAFLLSDKPLGCSTAFSRTAGMLERLVRGAKVHERPYYQQFRPHVDWEWMLVIGVLLGAFASALISGQFGLTWVPTEWEAHFGSSVLVRLGVALLGGFCIGFGARWAGGCTSGHGISGTLQLAVSGWIAVAGFFAGGVATAMFLFNVLAP